MSNRERYSGSDLYDCIWSLYPDTDVIGCSGDAWSLVYGDGNAQPKILVHVEKAGTQSIPHAIQEDCRKLLSQVARKASLPFGGLRFNSESSEIKRVEVSGALADQQSWESIQLSELSNRFRRHELDTSGGEVGKAINTKQSSAYHNWQRNALGQNVRVIDLDLFCCSPDQEVLDILEIKRSFYGLDEWTPWTEDQANYNLQASLAELADKHSTVAYHRKESVDEFSIFEVESGRPADSYRKVGVYTIDELLSGEYLEDLS